MDAVGMSAGLLDVGGREPGEPKAQARFAGLLSLVMDARLANEAWPTGLSASAFR